MSGSSNIGMAPYGSFLSSGLHFECEHNVSFYVSVYMGMSYDHMCYWFIIFRVSYTILVDYIVPVPFLLPNTDEKISTNCSCTNCSALFATKTVCSYVGGDNLE